MVLGESRSRKTRDYSTTIRTISTRSVLSLSIVSRITMFALPGIRTRAIFTRHSRMLFPREYRFSRPPSDIRHFMNMRHLLSVLSAMIRAQDSFLASQNWEKHGTIQRLRTVSTRCVPLLSIECRASPRLRFSKYGHASNFTRYF